LTVGIGGVRLWWGRRFKLCGAFTLAKAASPDEMRSVILACANSMFLLVQFDAGHD
jgi:hypothetical protein